MILVLVTGQVVAQGFQQLDVEILPQDEPALAPLPDNCLKVRAHKGGAARINSIISSVSPGGGTDAMAWARMAQQYYGHSSLSPIDSNLACQNSYVLVIGDGEWGNHSMLQRVLSRMLNNQKKNQNIYCSLWRGTSLQEV